MLADDVSLRGMDPCPIFLPWSQSFMFGHFLVQADENCIPLIEK